MAQYNALQEEELKLRIAEAFFAQYDCNTRIGKIDFCVTQIQDAKHPTEGRETVSLLWAEAKRGVVSDLYKPLVQLILTIGKARTFETYLPPPFLAAFDAEKIAFIPYKDILPFFALNDFNWNITPSDDSSREFGLLYGAVKDTLEQTSYTFYYDVHEAELREFIKQHVKVPNKPLPRVTNHRERKGSFFTPQIWVELSQQYLEQVLGDDWHEEYTIWDCAAGTGNLLNGLTNKYNIWASTLDQQDVDVMKDRIKNGANLLESHVFQFDFLNDPFTKLPVPLQTIINDPAKRRKLLIYINPPYAEAGNVRTLQRTGENKKRVTKGSTIHERYLPLIGSAANELFALFLMRVYTELKGAILGQFSKLKVLQASNFQLFRNEFHAALKSLFLIPAHTFDNVNGTFPIGFFIWDTAQEQTFERITADIYYHSKKRIRQKEICVLPESRELLTTFTHITSKEELNRASLGHFAARGPDIQNQRRVFIDNKLTRPASGGLHSQIEPSNLIRTVISFAVRLSIKQTWLNDRDQFLYPKPSWKKDNEFQYNCLAFTLFHTQNRISASESVNHWIPFTEQEVAAKEKFQSHFMTDFIAGRCPQSQKTKDERRKAQSEEKGQTEKTSASLRNLSEEESFIPTEPLVFSPEATAVFDAGRDLWRYYHAQPNANPNASYYDIREHFQGRNKNGRMNPTSDDMEYMRLLGNLKNAMEALRQQIVPKVYEYGFLI